jgi:hypothetical protein
LAKRYNVITINVPNANASGILRFGSFTSPAVNVMLFQASAEKSEPVWATQIPTNKPNAVAAVRPPPKSSSAPRTCQKFPKFARTTSLCQPIKTPSTINPKSAASFAVVNEFWTSLPSFNPRVFMNVSSTISRMAMTCAVDSEMA